MERITADSPPFTFTGLYCFGPFLTVHMWETVERYGCLFICFNTRAVHIEMLHSLDSDEFLLALGRFISRRTAPEKMFSDRGSNFVAARKELRVAVKTWRENDNINKQLTQRGTEWIFQPPKASPMGGIWELQIRGHKRLMIATYRHCFVK